MGIERYRELSYKIGATSGPRLAALAGVAVASRRVASHGGRCRGGATYQLGQAASSSSRRGYIMERRKRRREAAGDSSGSKPRGGREGGRREEKKKEEEEEAERKWEKSTSVRDGE